MHFQNSISFSVRTASLKPLEICVTFFFEHQNLSQRKTTEIEVFFMLSNWNNLKEICTIKKKKRKEKLHLYLKAGEKSLQTIFEGRNIFVSKAAVCKILNENSKKTRNFLKHLYYFVGFFIILFFFGGRILGVRVLV